MRKPISVGQVWILEQMSERGGISELMSTTTAPEPVRMAALRGVEKRGLCRSNGNGIFTITELGRKAFADNKARLIQKRAELRRESEARIAAEDAAEGNS